jgi:DnaJ-class molecular chaperone
MKITKTYLTGCNWCGGIGQKFPMQHDGTTFSSICPVCNGTKVILVTETTEYDKPAKE